MRGNKCEKTKFGATSDRNYVRKKVNEECLQNTLMKRKGKKENKRGKTISGRNVLSSCFFFVLRRFEKKNTLQRP